MKKFNIAIVGATGLVGSNVLKLLHERKFPTQEIKLVASERSAGNSIAVAGKDFHIENLAGFDFSAVDIAFFCVSKQLAAQYIPLATAKGCVVIDKSTCYRNDPQVPLIVPEVNLPHLAQFKQKGIIASPNCSTIPIAVAIKPLVEQVGVERLNIATYQSVSGTGKDAIAELVQQTKQYLQGTAITHNVYPQQIAFNVLPHIDDFDENGYSKEEMKVVNELQKIFAQPDMAVNPTTVRVPVFCGHAAAVHLETKQPIDIVEVNNLLATAEGVKLVDDARYPYPTPAKNAAGTDFVYVGRVRKDISHAQGINLWIVADNLRKGAALNALQIAEHLIKTYL